MMATNSNPKSERTLTVHELTSLADSLTVSEIRLLLALKQTEPLPAPSVVHALPNPLQTCPHCQHTGPAERDFGPRMVRGELYYQSWCRKCRANPRRSVSAS